MPENLEEFRRFRERMNDRILEAGNLEIKRFFALDTLDQLLAKENG